MAHARGFGSPCPEPVAGCPTSAPRLPSCPDPRRLNGRKLPSVPLPLLRGEMLPSAALLPCVSMSRYGRRRAVHMWTSASALRLHVLLLILAHPLRCRRPTSASHSGTAVSLQWQSADHFTFDITGYRVRP